MLRLDATTKIMQLIATGTANVTVSGLNVTSAAATGVSEETAATASTQTIAAAPAASTVKQIDHISIKNTQAGANTFTVQVLNSSGAVTTVQAKATLAADETLEYTHAGGWQTLDATGSRKAGTAGWVIAAGKIGTLSNSLTLAGTDGSTLNVGTGGTLGTSAYITLGANVGTWMATPSSANLLAAITDETGTGALVFANTPTLVTPVLGVATATSINKMAITAPATSSTLAVADGKTATHSATTTFAGVDGKTLTINNSLTLAGTDGTTMTFPTTTATLARTDAAQSFTGLQTFLTGITSTAASNSFGATVFSGAITGGQAATLGAVSGTTGTFSGNVTLGDATTDTVRVFGNVGIGNVSDPAIALRIDNDTLVGTTQYAIRSAMRSASDATANTIGFDSQIGTATAAYTTANMYHHRAGDGTKGAGSTITNQYGFYSSNLTNGGTLNIGFAHNLSSGAGKWGFYGVGTADNAFAGNVRIGSTTAPTVALDVTGAIAGSTIAGIGVATSATTTLNLAAGTTGVSSLRVPHGAAPTSPVNGDIWTTTAGIYVRINGATVGPLS